MEPKQEEVKTPEAPLAATAKDIKAMCPKADSDWILAQVENESTKEQVITAYLRLMEQQVDAKEKEAIEAKEKAEQAKAEADKAQNKSGADALGEKEHKESKFDGGAVAFLNEKVSMLKASGVDHLSAYDQVYKNHPELYAEIQAEKGVK